MTDFFFYEVSLTWYAFAELIDTKTNAILAAILNTFLHYTTNLSSFSPHNNSIIHSPAVH